jgi:hypothetical protein
VEVTPITVNADTKLYYQAIMDVIPRVHGRERVKGEAAQYFGFYCCLTNAKPRRRTLTKVRSGGEAWRRFRTYIGDILRYLTSAQDDNYLAIILLIIFAGLLPKLHFTHNTHLTYFQLKGLASKTEWSGV